MLTINSGFLLRKRVNYSVNLVSNRIMDSTRRRHLYCDGGELSEEEVVKEHRHHDTSSAVTITGR